MGYQKRVKKSLTMSYFGLGLKFTVVSLIVLVSMSAVWFVLDFLFRSLDPTLGTILTLVIGIPIQLWWSGFMCSMLWNWR